MWSMPPSVLRVVAVLIGLCAFGGLVLGVLGTPEKGRLPGETGAASPSVPLTASELMPLDEEAPAPTPVKEDPKPEETPKPEEATPETAPPVAPPPAMPAPAKPPVAEDRVGDLLDGVTPPPSEDPPH